MPSPRTTARSARRKRSADATASISRLTATRDGLHRKRQDALRQGNYLRARMFEALLASNTGNLLEAILPHLPPGPERQRYGQRMQEARASADAFKASLAPSGR